VSDLLPPLAHYVSARLRAIDEIPIERRDKLDVLVDYIEEQKRAQKSVSLNFICTHNSRRSHLGQIWGAVSAAQFGIEQVSTFSGGTEATAFNPRAVAAVQRAGLFVEGKDEANPRYKVTYSEQEAPLVCFSKCFDDAANPSADFAAVMTCNDADRNCPAILGATRISLPYRDPKEADDTPQETERYDERCRQIATEMLYVFSELKSRLSTPEGVS
jgi:protein-tyrosine-phosphatase